MRYLLITITRNFVDKLVATRVDFNYDNIVSIVLSRQLCQKKETFTRKLSESPSVKDVSFSMYFQREMPGNRGVTSSGTGKKNR